MPRQHFNFFLKAMLENLKITNLKNKNIKLNMNKELNMKTDTKHKPKKLK